MNDSLFSNKLAAAVLIVLLLFVGLPVISHTFEQLTAGHHDHHFEEENPFGLAYTPYAELVGVAPAGAGEEVEVTLGCLMAEASADRGARGAQACAACHSFNEGGANGTGPALWNVVGREIGGVDGYAYSAALQNAEGAWTYEKLDPYLYDSQQYLPGTQMVQKVRKDGKRADILAYLGSLTNGEPVAYPECVPAAEEVADVAAEAAGR